MKENKILMVLKNRFIIKHIKELVSDKKVQGSNYEIINRRAKKREKNDQENKKRRIL